LMKKTEGRKSRDRVPLIRVYLEHFLLDENPGRLNLIQEPLASTLRPA
jgi:hypothetical protein